MNTLGRRSCRLVTLVLSGLFAFFSDTRVYSQTDSGSVIAEGSVVVDTGELLNRQGERNEVLLSGRMFRALANVIDYRRRKQSKELTRTELDPINFDFRIIPGARSTWLTDIEKRDCFAVVLEPKLKPGEKVLLHGPRSLGRIAGYAVRISDGAVLRAEIRPW